MEALYSKHSLSLAEHDIRLIEVFPYDQTGPIKCSFHRHPRSTCPPYVALSYTWGDEHNYKEISIEGTNFSVGKNLWWFLYYMHLREKPQLFWIDAICVNQTDTQERNHQVQLMKEIYEGAESVAVWLGEGTPETDMAMESMQKYAAELDTGFHSSQQWKFWHGENGRALRNLWNAPYWSRVWVLQEIMHAKNLTIYCGQKGVSWEGVSRVYEKMEFDACGYSVRDVDVLLEVVESPAGVLILTKSTFDGRRIPFPTLLGMHRLLESTDIRDKVFGLLSLAPESMSEIVNYSLSPKEVLLSTLKIVAGDDDEMTKFELEEFGMMVQSLLEVELSDDELYDFIALALEQQQRKKPK